MLYVPHISILSSDWDGTIADTFTPSPNGRGVEAGYRHALGAMFGDPELLDLIGGLKNRAPSEVVVAVLGHDSSLGIRGLTYYEAHCRELRDLVPRGKGIQSRHPTLVETLTETLVRIRLQYLLPEISPEWPKPFDGALETLADIQARGVQLAVISSGHTRFIQRTCEVWGVPAPVLMITDDDMRALGKAPHETCKPSRLLMDMLVQRAYASTAMVTSGVAHDVVAYLGDCPHKDRMLAKNADVRFGWFNPKRQTTPADFGAGEFQFHSWQEVPSKLH